ncbi:MAG: sigma-70 family RNA polymerase sigma factor [Phycisphaerales bacterium]
MDTGFLPALAVALGSVVNSPDLRARARLGATMGSRVEQDPSKSTTPEDFSRAHAALAGWTRRRLSDLCGDPHVGEDLAQQTWKAVWEACSTGRYDPKRSAMSTFVYAVGQNVFRHWARRQATAAAWADSVVPDEPQPEPADEAEVIDEVRRVVRDGLPGLGSEHVQVLRLLGQGLTDRELAKELGVAPSTANARKRAALDGLREHLEKRFPSERRAAERQEPEGTAR